MDFRKFFGGLLISTFVFLSLPLLSGSNSSLFACHGNLSCPSDDWCDNGIGCANGSVPVCSGNDDPIGSVCCETENFSLHCKTCYGRNETCPNPPPYTYSQGYYYAYTQGYYYGYTQSTYPPVYSYGQGYYQGYYEGYYYGQASYCTPNFQCEIPFNGFENDGCGARQPNVNCNPAWLQAGGGSTHSNAAISGLSIPAGLYFNPAPYGIVSSNSAINFTPSQTNANSWQLTNYPAAGTAIHTNPRYDHDYFWTRYQDQISEVVNANTITSGDLQSSDEPVFIAIHPIAGNSVTTSTPINVTGGKLVVVFVNSPNGPVNLTLGDRVTVGNDSFVIWIVSGNVTVSSSVSQADGYYVVSGSYNNGSGQTQMTVSGGVAAYSGITLGRRMADTNVPAEVFTYNPTIYEFIPVLGESLYGWEETVP